MVMTRRKFYYEKNMGSNGTAVAVSAMIFTGCGSNNTTTGTDTTQEPENTDTAATDTPAAEDSKGGDFWDSSVRYPERKDRNKEELLSNCSVSRQKIPMEIKLITPQIQQKSPTVLLL